MSPYPGTFSTKGKNTPPFRDKYSTFSEIFNKNRILNLCVFENAAA